MNALKLARNAIAPVLVAVIFGLTQLPSSAMAQGQGQAGSAAEAASLVRAQAGGRVLAVRTVQQGAHKVYRVKVLTRRGVVRIVTIGHTGF